MRAIFEHEACEVAGGVGTEYGALEALPDEIGNIAAVINMGVGEEQEIDFSGVEWEFLVAFHRFLAFSLEEATFEEELLTAGFEEVHGPCGRSCSPVNG
jgi:hypothetical protein